MCLLGNLIQFDIDTEIHTFVKQTKVRRLTLGPSVRQILEQWDPLCKFIKDLEKDTASTPESAVYKHAALAQCGDERIATQIMRQFLNNVTPF